MHYIVAKTDEEAHAFADRTALDSGQYCIFYSSATMRGISPENYVLEAGDKITYIHGWEDGFFAQEMIDFTSALASPGIRLQRVW